MTGGTSRLSVASVVAASFLAAAGAVSGRPLADDGPGRPFADGPADAVRLARHAVRPPAPVRPHPAVVRIVVPERNGTSYGSGTLVDVRAGYGLVVTNWHVIRDAAGTIQVYFPDGFWSAARALKMDQHWDLAALVIWKPKVAPMRIARRAPQPGDVLAIAGYGRGTYRTATGRCTQYVAPGIRFPYEMVELDVAARQGDSGGPIFNQNGELAGVLFGSGGGSTVGAFCGRVGGFLASLAPDIGSRPATAVARATPPPEPPEPIVTDRMVTQLAENPPRKAPRSPSLQRPERPAAAALPGLPATAATPPDLSRQIPLDGTKTILAAIGAVAVLFGLSKLT